MDRNATTSPSTSAMSPNAAGFRDSRQSGNPMAQTKALSPVIDLPTISVFISRVPSKE